MGGWTRQNMWLERGQRHGSVDAARKMGGRARRSRRRSGTRGGVMVITVGDVIRSARRNFLLSGRIGIKPNIVKRYGAGSVCAGGIVPNSETGVVYEVDTWRCKATCPY